MTMTGKLIAECERRGVTLEPRGDKLWIEPEERTTPELVQQLRMHKFEIISALETKWQVSLLHTAKQVMLNEFSGCSTATRERLINDLFRSEHLICQRAVCHLNQKSHC